MAEVEEQTEGTLDALGSPHAVSNNQQKLVRLREIGTLLWIKRSGATYSTEQRLLGELLPSRMQHMTRSSHMPRVVLHSIEKIARRESHWVEHMLLRYSRSHLHRS